MATIPISKICARCGEEKPSSSFYASKQQSDGLYPYCKPCVSDYRKEERARKGDQIRRCDNERRKHNKGARLAIERRAAAKRRKAPGYYERCREERKARAFQAYIASDTTRRCEICSVSYCNVYGNLSWMTVCSDECARVKALRKRIRNEKVRRHRKRGVQCEVVDPFKVFDRDGWKCQLCGVLTPKSLRGSYHDRAPELDHILPLAAGGAHTYANTQCSCRKCNRKKWMTPLGQLHLFPI